MKRFTILLILSTIAIFAAPSVSTASAASCSAASVGGENAPTVDSTSGTVSETGEQGYKCTIQWDAELTVQYESGGVWHTATDAAPQFHPQTGLWPASSAFDWPLLGRNLTDPDESWSPTIEVPVCSFNWRVHLDFLNSGGSNFQSNNSPQTAKTC